MYVNMTTDKLAVPLNENGKLASKFSGSRRNRASKNTLIAAAAFIFVVINVSLIVFTILTLSRVKILEDDVDLLKNSLAESIHEVKIMKVLTNYENELDMVSISMPTKHVKMLFIIIIHTKSSVERQEIIDIKLI